MAGSSVVEGAGIQGKPKSTKAFPTTERPQFPAPKLLSSPRHVKQRTQGSPNKQRKGHNNNNNNINNINNAYSRRTRASPTKTRVVVKDGVSGHSSITSRTCSSHTDLSSMFSSVNNMSPISASGDNKPKVEVEMSDSMKRRGGNLRPTKSLVVEGSNESSSKQDSTSASDQDDGEQQGSRQQSPIATSRKKIMPSEQARHNKKQKSLSPTATAATVPTQSKSKDSKNKMNMQKAHDGANFETRVPDRWEASSEGSSRRTMSLVEDSTEDEGDVLGPLIGAVARRSQRSIGSGGGGRKSQKSIDTSFSASYGTISLGGDTSMSSLDTFHNSPITHTKKRPIPVRHKPDLTATPTKKILKPNPDPNPVHWKRICRLPSISSDGSSDDSDDETSSDSDSHPSEDSESCSSSSSSNEHSSPSLAQAKAFMVKGIDSSTGSTVWEEPLKMEGNTRKNWQTQKRISDVSVDSGDVSIATYSDGSISQSLHQMSSSEINNSTDADESKEIFQLGPKSLSLNFQDRKSSIDSSMIGTWGNQVDFSITTDEEKRSIDKRSYSSWTSGTESWATPKDASEHWAEPLTRTISDWTSDSDSSVIENKLNSFSEKNKSASFNVNQDQLPTATRKPCSAYDKNAPWYCGDEGEEFPIRSIHDDTLHSTSSSVLSHFRKSSKKANTLSNVQEQRQQQEEEEPESSLNFSVLMKPMSSLLGKSKAQKAVYDEEQSLTLNEVMMQKSLSSTSSARKPKSMKKGSLKREAVLTPPPPRRRPRPPPTQEMKSNPKKTRSVKQSKMDLIEEKPSRRESKHKTNALQKCRAEEIMEEGGIEITPAVCARQEGGNDSTTNPIDDQSENLENSEPDETKSKFLRLVESKWFIPLQCVAVLLFLLFDICLVIVFLVNK